MSQVNIQFSRPNMLIQIKRTCFLFQRQLDPQYLFIYCSLCIHHVIPKVSCCLANLVSLFVCFFLVKFSSHRLAPHSYPSVISPSCCLCAASYLWLCACGTRYFLSAWISAAPDEFLFRFLFVKPFMVVFCCILLCLIFPCFPVKNFI